MIKKILIYMLSVLLIGSASAEELFMKCGITTYKYSTDSSGDTIFLKNKHTKNKYEPWCDKNKPPRGAILVEGHNRIIENYKGICMVAKVVYDDGYELKSNTSVTDFKALTRNREYFDNTGPDKKVDSYKCKKRKK